MNLVGSLLLLCPNHELLAVLGLVSSLLSQAVPSVLWRCWLGGRKGIRPVKTEWWGAGMVICLERGAHWHMAQLMPLPLAVSCFSKIQIGFTFLIPAHLGSPEKGPLNGCVCVCKSSREERLSDDLFCVEWDVKPQLSRADISVYFTICQLRMSRILPRLFRKNVKCP